VNVGTFVVSLDFELHWGVCDIRTVAEDRARLLGGRQAVPRILSLFEEFGIHATWAIVGLLLVDGRRELLARLPPRRMRPEAPGPACDPAVDVGESERDDPFHFAPSLVRRIAATPGQEIGTHTFTHYHCLEADASPSDLRADLAAAVAVTHDKLQLTPRSLVFPRNQVSRPYVEVAGEMGVMAYRGNPRTWAYRECASAGERLVRRAVRLADAYLPLVHRGRGREAPAAAVPVDVTASRFLRPRSRVLRRLEPLRERRLAQELERAARTDELYHLWWHPEDFGRDLLGNLALLRRLLRRFARLRDAFGMESLGMAEAAARRAASGGARERVPRAS
jgi:peptidoglycan/xylan/chitin deacetylase (PgdA/CDA1 family)